MESNLNEKSFATEIGLVTDNVNGIVKIAENNGATIVDKPKEKPWGQTVASIKVKC
jgi:uncharacterized glyoxalase superfamily protein PhnB